MNPNNDKNPDPVHGQVEVEKTAELLGNHTPSGAATQAAATTNARTGSLLRPAAKGMPELLQDRRERARRQREERQAKYEHWLEQGSDRLDDAWVSICPYAQSHDVEPMLLTGVVEAIQTGGPIPVVGKWGTKDFFLDDNQAKVRRLYTVGCHEAETLNRPRIRRLLENLGLKVDLSHVRVLTEQPKENTKLFFVSALVVDGTSYPVRERIVYHIPQVLGKHRADDAKKATPGVTLAALCLGQRNMNYVGGFTGLYPLDLDDTADVPQLRSLAVEHPCVRLVFTSITGSGMRVCALGPVARDPEEYKKLYKNISEKLCREWGVESKADDSTYDPARLTFLPYDPQIFFQP